MKRSLLSLLLTTILAASIAACDKSGSETSTGSGASSGSGGSGSGGGGSGAGSGWPAALPVDCAAPGAEDLVCNRPGVDDDDTFFPGAVGAGPHFSYGAFPAITGGFLDAGTDRLIVSAVFGSDSVNPSGAIVAVDLHTGDRTFVSGDYVDEGGTPHAFGSGESITYFTDVKAGPSAWYALGQIVDGGGKEDVLAAIDPTSGARQVIWREGNNTCPAWGNGKIGPVIDSLAVGPDGTVYVAFSNNPAQAGVGVLGIDPSGGCKIVSRVHCSGSDCSLTVGSGPDPDWLGGYFKGMSFGGGLIWGVEWQTHSLFSVDPVTGNRSRVSSTYSGLPGGDIGSGPDLGVEGVVYRDASTLFTSGGTVVAVDGTSGDRTAVLVAPSGPMKVQDPSGTVFLHTNPSWLLLVQKTAIVVLDTKTGNNNVLSY